MDGYYQHYGNKFRPVFTNPLEYFFIIEFQAPEEKIILKIRNKVFQNFFSEEDDSLTEMTTPFRVIFE
jgi:hypothetical protein